MPKVHAAWERGKRSRWVRWWTQAQVGLNQYDTMQIGSIV